MRVSRVLVAVAVAAALAGACAVAPALASTPTPTSFGFVDGSEGFSYTNPTIAVRGELFETVSATQSEPVPDEPVTVTEQVAGVGPAKDVASVMTDGTGQFTVVLPGQAAGGIFEAVFAGGDGLAASTSAPLRVIPPEFSSVHVSYGTAPASPVAAGAVVTFSGTVDVPADDNGNLNPETPIAGALVYVFTGPQWTSASPHAVTSADGTFSVPVRPAATTAYRVEVVSPEPFPYCLYVCQFGALGTTVTVLSPRPTRVEGFTVPATHEIHGTFAATGTVQQLSGTTWQSAASASVALFYRSLPSGKWISAGSTRTGPAGNFSWKAGVRRLGKLAWQARVEQSAGYRASSSAAKDSLLVDRTYVTHMTVTHLNGHTSLRAVIQDFPQSGGAHDANVTGAARFYYEAAGTATWRYLGQSSATSASHGSVGISPAGTLDGNFRIVFPAQGDFLGSVGTRSLA